MKKIYIFLIVLALTALRIQTQLSKCPSSALQVAQGNYKSIQVPSQSPNKVKFLSKLELTFNAITTLSPILSTVLQESQ